MDNNNNNKDDVGSSFAGSNQRLPAYDPALFNSANINVSQNSSWGAHNGLYSGQSRAGHQVPTWQQNGSAISPYTSQPALQQTATHVSSTFAPNQYGGYAQNLPYGPPQYDPALFAPSPTSQGYDNFTCPQSTQATNTIAPQALQHNAQPIATTTSAWNNSNHPVDPGGHLRPANHAAYTPVFTVPIPQGRDHGYFSIIDPNELARATDSIRLGEYVHVGKKALEWPATRAMNLPQYVARHSKNTLRQISDNDPTLLAKIGKRSMKHKTGMPSVIGRPKQAMRNEVQTSSTDESSEDDDSDDSSDNDMEHSPLPSKRPDNPKEAVEYDTIRALWRPKRKAVDGATIRKGILDFWDIVKTIRDRWKADSTAVTEAEEKKRTGELPLLKSRVKDQRDMIESAFKTAHKHGHRSIVELLGQNSSLVYLCYQFLLDRFKAEDLNGALSRSMLETMSLFTTLDNAVLEKTHLDKVLVRYSKRGDARTQFHAKRIVQNAESVTKQKEADPSQAKSTAKTLPVLQTEPVAGVKRPASTIQEEGASKKAATGVKPVKVSEPKSPTATSGTAVKAKQVTAKPSSFFSSLRSASKKPGTWIKSGTPAQATDSRPVDRKNVGATAPLRSTFSFAETMANLAKPKDEKADAKPKNEQLDETPAEREKRLRKEARRKLHVHFKTGEDLVQIRYFTHDPEEEIGHNASQMRDVADAGGEGRALKLHHGMMNLDDDEEEEQKLLPWKEISSIDFTVLDVEERQKMYRKYGGGELNPEATERLEREQAEANTLMVTYTDRDDIPPNPREPTESSHDEMAVDQTNFGSLETYWVDEAKKRTSARAQREQTTNPDSGPIDIQAILQSLNWSAPAQSVPTVSAAPSMAYSSTHAPPPPAIPTPQTAGQAAPDLSAILAAIQSQQPVPAQEVTNDGDKSQLYKTKACRFWKEGKCNRGSNCTYLHRE